MLRDGDYLARSASDTFAVVLRRCGERDATQIAHRSLERFRAQAGPAADGIQVDLGMSFYPPDGTSPQSARLLRMSRSRLDARVRINLIFDI